MAITRVQGNKRGTDDINGYISITLDNTPQNGNVLVLTFASADTSAYRTVSSISQTGVTWTKQISKTKYGSRYEDSEIWFGVVGSGASKSVTVNMSAYAGHGAVANVCEYSGVATSSFLDQTAANSGASNANLDSGTTPQTQQANELWIASLAQYSASTNQSSPTNGFTLLDGVLFDQCTNGYLEKIVSSQGQADAGDTGENSAYGWAVCIATFFASGAGYTQNITEDPATATCSPAAEGLTESATASVMISNVAVPLTETNPEPQIVISNITVPLSEVANQTLSASLSGNVVNLTETGLETTAIANVSLAIIETASEVASISNITFTLTQVATESTAITNVAFTLTQASLESSQVSNVSIPLTEVATETGAAATFSITETATQAVNAYSGAVKVTRLFLIIGDLAIQLTG